MKISLSSINLLAEDAPQRSDGHINAGLAGHRHKPGLCRVPKVAVTALLSHLHPAVTFKRLDKVAQFHDANRCNGSADRKRA